MKRSDFTNLGGLPLTQDRLAFMQSGYNEMFAAIAKLCGNKTILDGVVVTGSNVSDGWIAYNGELIRFIGGSVAAQVVITEAATSLVFADASSHNVHFDKTATCGAVGDFAFTDLKRLNNIFAALIQMKGYVSYIGRDVVIGDVVADKFVTIDIPDQGTSDYVVGGSLVGYGTIPGNDNDVAWTVRSLTPTAFTICVTDMNASTLVQNLKFNFTITKEIS